MWMVGVAGFVLGLVAGGWLAGRLGPALTGEDRARVRGWTRRGGSEVGGRGAEGPLVRARLAESFAREHTQDALLAAFRPEEVPEPEEAIASDRRLLAQALRDVRHRRGAVLAVLWTLDEAMGGEVVPVAWSSVREPGGSADDPPPRDEATLALVRWAARERQLTFDGGEGAPRLAVAPLTVDEVPGAVSLHFDDGAHVTRDAIREWLPIHATMIQSWHELVRTRSDVARQNFRLRGLIRTAGTLQATRDPLELERLLVADSLTVVGADWSVLVRWDETAGAARLRAATAGAIALGLASTNEEVSVESIAGQVCVEGRPQIFPDARALTRGGDQVFGTSSPLGAVGSLLAVPLRRGDQERPIGALVCGHAEVSALRATEARNARNLAVIAAGALETAWAVEDARRNARTDPLTGLANRRGFSERFTQVIAETDRYGGAAALVMVDLDHFKRINDTYGHDAGDKVLQAVAGVLSEGRRTVDLAARLGGEELALLLPQTDAGGAREVAERIRQRVEALRIRTAAGEVRVTASFGVGEYAARQGYPEEVAARADQALYAAKRHGRNRVEVVA